MRIRDIATYTSNCRTHASALKDVGRSLADIAAFMHEVEVRQGYVPSPDDKRGIERARQLAKKLQELSNTLPNGSSSQVWGLSNRQQYSTKGTLPDRAAATNNISLPKDR